MNCANCDFNDGKIYTSLPPKYFCTIKQEFHFGDYDCGLDSRPHWEKVNNLFVRCSNCETLFAAHRVVGYNYCPNCGGKLREKL